MAGRRLLDVAALFNASRGIARKHVALRQEQLNLFTRTSSLAKAVRAQAERYTETAKAASFLASRLNEDKPSWAKEARETSSSDFSHGDTPIAGAKDAGPGVPQASKRQKGILEQDHLYEDPALNPSTNPAPKDTLAVQQENADRYPLPDGTIPPKVSDHHLTPGEARLLQREYERQIPSRPADGNEGHSGDGIEGFDSDSFYHPSQHISPVLSSLPRVKVPKHLNSVQANDVHLSDKDINSDSYSSSVQTSTSARGRESDPLTVGEDVPQGINTAIFSNPRVARSLGGRTHISPPPVYNHDASQDVPNQTSQSTRSEVAEQSYTSTTEAELFNSGAVEQKIDAPISDVSICTRPKIKPKCR